MPSVYIVMGTTGEYSDGTEWPVIAYLNKADAEWHADKAAVWAHNNREQFRIHKNTPAPLVNPWDKDMQMDSAGTDYYAMGPIDISTRKVTDVITETG